jgi:hypothetical protein
LNEITIIVFNIKVTAKVGIYQGFLLCFGLKAFILILIYGYANPIRLASSII